MRIVSGSLGGRLFSSPHGHRTHPMSEKVRGALFNSLGDIGGLTVLDAFAGSGALSFEAISRGAGSALAIDSDKSAQRAIIENVQALKLSDKIKLIKANAYGWSRNNPDELFDVVLLDPPFTNLQEELLAKLAAHSKPGGTVVLSLPPTSNFSLPSTIYHLLSTKFYGDAQLVFYHRV